MAVGRHFDSDWDAGRADCVYRAGHQRRQLRPQLPPARAAFELGGGQLSRRPVHRRRAHRVHRSKSTFVVFIRAGDFGDGHADECAGVGLGHGQQRGVHCGVGCAHRSYLDGSGAGGDVGAAHGAHGMAGFAALVHRLAVDAEHDRREPKERRRGALAPRRGATRAKKFGRGLRPPRTHQSSLAVGPRGCRESLSLQVRVRRQRQPRVAHAAELNHWL